MLIIKNIGIAFLLLLVVFACESKDEEMEVDPSIIGTWKLVEVYNDSGDGSGKWVAVKDSHQFVFSEDHQFISDRFSSCTQGTYSINDNQLILDYGCEGFTLGFEEPEGTLIEYFTLETKQLVLTPAYLNCIEGCGWKFKKLR